MSRGLAEVALVFTFALAAGCGAGADSAGPGSTGVDSPKADPVEQLLLEFASGPGFDPDLGTVEFADCRPLEGVEYEGHPAFYCEFGNAATIADMCVARVGDRLYFSGGKLMCEDPFELVYPLER
jgi:hypothetical protein